MATEQLYQYVGTITQSEEPAVKAGQAQRTRFQITTPDGNSQWFTAFPDVSRVMQSQPQAVWSLGYTIWTGNNGSESYTIKSATNHGQAAPQAPPPQAQAPVQAMPQQAQPQAMPQQPPVQQAPPPQAPAQETSCQHGYSHLAKCTPCIQREVAFKEIEDKDGKSYDTLNDLTNNYTAILQGTYQPSAQPPVDENFIQTEF